MDDLQSVEMGKSLLEEQESIVRRLDAIASSQIKEKEQLQKLILLKTGLMQDLLTGKVPVKPDESDEVTINA